MMNTMQLVLAGVKTGLTALLLGGALGAYAQVPSNPYDYTRESSFTYDAVTGQLKTETVEPTHAQLCAVTTYGYDAYGNKLSVKTDNCAGASGRALIAERAASSTFAGVASQPIVVEGSSTNVVVPAGLFADTGTNVFLHSESRTYDPRFGTPLSVTGPNGLATRTEVDDFGRVSREVRADGTSSITVYCYLSGRGLDTSSNSAACATIAQPVAGEAPADAVLFVHTETHDSADVVNSAFNRAYMDRVGRKIRVVTQAFDYSAQIGGTTRLVVQDTDYNAYGVAVVATQPYFLDSGSSTASGANNYGMTRTDYDVLGRPVSMYVADSKGLAGSVAFGSRGSRVSAKTTVVYAGLSTTTTNDRGEQRLEERNAGGKLTRTTDAMGAQVAQEMDAFDNLVATRDALQNATTLSYDLRGRKVSMNDPDTGLWKYDYDALGELVWQESPNQRASATSTTMVYDALGRMTSRADPEYTSTWTFDTCAMGKGKLCRSSTTNGITRTFSYDSYGRSLNVRTDVAAGPSFGSGLTYDNVNGRVSGQIYPTGLKVTYGYTPLGYLQNVQTGAALVVSPLPMTPGGSVRTAGSTIAKGVWLWAGLSTSAWGGMEQQRNNQLADGTSVKTTTTFDPYTGRMLTQKGGLNGATNSINLAYVWDDVGRLTQRTDNNGDGLSGAVSDTMLYDDVGRLQSYTVAGPAQQPNLTRTVSFEYNALGATLYKSDVGIYSYPASGSARPHAVQSVAGAYTASYGYDGNGNLKTASAGGYRAISYTSFNMPDSQAGLQAAAGGPQYAWSYDETHQRFKEVRTSAAGTRTTWMLHPDNAGGLAFEREEQASGNSNRHYVSVGGTTVAVIVSTGALPSLAAGAMVPPVLSTINVVKVEFWHQDQLGNLVSTTDHGGQVTALYSYDPFGKRRQTTGSYDGAGNLVVDWTNDTDHGTDRGYTGHEHLDDVGVIHMNGRLYDPLLGRFMQGDPLIQDPGNLQNYDRYGYCYNSPGGCSDPTGFCFAGCFWQPKGEFQTYMRQLAGKALRAAYLPTLKNQFDLQRDMPGQRVVDHFIVTHPWAYAIGQMVATYYSAICGGCGGAAWAAYYSYVESGSIETAYKTGAITWATSYATSYLQVNTGGEWGLNVYESAGAQAVVAGTSARLQGGSFKKGFEMSMASSALAIANHYMRAAMVEQSKIDFLNDGTGKSRGIDGDNFKLGGGRFNPWAVSEPSPLGGDQFGPGQIKIPLFGTYHYDPGSLADLVVESFAGPHDMANSIWYYNDVTGDIRSFTGWSTFQQQLLEASTNYTTSLMFAAPFAAGTFINQTHVGYWQVPGKH